MFRGEVFIILRLFTEALGEFLAARLSDIPEKPVASFALPGAIAGKNAINIFLCSLAEDPELRSNEKQYERAGDGWVSIPPPLRLKCTYIVSACPAGKDPEEAALLQLDILSAAYGVLASAGTLPSAYLPAPMKATGLPRPVIALADNGLPGDPEFWASAGCAFRPAFSFTATVALPATEEHYDHVVEGLQIDYKTGTQL